MKKPRFLTGFTLVEIMIVVAIIALLAAIAIPNLLRARISAQENAVASAVHTIVAAEIQWRASNPSFASLNELVSANPPYIDSAFADSLRYGYAFVASPNAGLDFFVAAYKPQGDLPAGHAFYMDEDGVLCRSIDEGVQPPFGHHSEPGCPNGFSEVE